MDHFEVETFTDLQGRRMMKHVPTRWISLQGVLLRVLEQFNNLRKCFLRVLPTEKGFDGKYEIGASDRYKRIKKTLNNKTLPAIAYAVIFYHQDFKNFQIYSQSNL